MNKLLTCNNVEQVISNKLSFYLLAHLTR